MPAQPCVTLVTIVKLRNHPRYPKSDELVEKIWYIQVHNEINLISPKED